MISKEIYPKTTRVKTKDFVTITEKLDGANLGLFNKNGELIIATRSVIFSFSELDNKEVKDNIKTYKGLYQWIKDHGNELISNLYPESGIFGEWMGCGKLAYSSESGLRGHHFYMFAKARITEDFHAERIMYDHDLFRFPFLDEKIPKYIDVVPVVLKANQVPSLEELNELYDKYTEKVGRNVEGFVINYYDNIRKYVRMKNNKLEDHHE